MKRSFIILLYKIAYRLNEVRRWLLRPLSLGVKVMLIHDNEILLVRHTYQPGWFIPGGGIKRGETLEEAAHREAWEELGATLKDISLFGFYSNVDSHKSEHIIVFTCYDFTLSDKEDYEIAEAAFFPINKPPPDISKGNGRRLQEYHKSESSYPIIGIW